MSSIQERLQLKRVPLDTWNIREQLCLASAVVRSGDQNWMSVSRALKTVGEPNRPSDWYSQKSCAAQYGALLENVETPKRKKRSSEGAVETPQESILKKLTQERIVEIQKTVAELTQQYELVKNELLEVRDPSTSEERLKEMWNTVETAKRNRERENARRAAWLKEREEKSARAERAWKSTTSQAQQPGTASPAPPSSPLLTSLLKSSPVVTTPQSISHPANIIETVSPSAGAPTLSMLLEKPGSVSITQTPTTNPTTTVEQQESKHAAIEHIKSQLVQIEQQLIASTSASPVSLAPAPAPAIEIDDIEIKAEDVYAFRDIDIHIPPVTTMHKGTPRTVEKTLYKKGDEELDQDVASEDAVVELVDDIKEESLETTAETEDALHTEPESAAEETSIQEESSSVPEIIETTPETEPKISFPEVKFPTPEIKVIQPDERKVKEEIKEPDIPLQVPEKNPVEEVEHVEENVTTEVAEEESEETPKATEIVPEKVIEQTDVEEKPVGTEEVVPTEKEAPNVNYPENIPLPPDIPQIINDDVCVSEVPLPPEPEVLPIQEVEKSTEEQKTNKDETELIELKDLGFEVPVKHEEVKKDNIEETLSKMMKEEVEPEVKPDRPLELEENHTETDDDTPMELSREEDRDGKKKRDYSRKKKPDSRTCSGSESAAEASAPDSPSASDAERQHRLWRKSVMLVYSRLCAHKYASLFLRPISDEEAPGYSVVIKRPMDLSTIKRNIDSGVIRTTAQFQRDVLLMLSNALMYNSSEHSVYQMAKDMHEEAECQLGMLLAAQAHAGLQVGTPPVAATRKRRRADSPYQPPSKRHNY